MQPKPTAKQIFADHRSVWDNHATRPDALDAILRMLACKTPALGAEVYRSEGGEERIIPHTCKSRACSSCGMWRTLCWQREIAACLPDVPFAGVGFSMHSDFWGIFQRNRHLIPHLAAIAAGVLQDWARRQYGAEVMVLAVTHTFGGYLNFNTHVHLMVSTVGLDRTGRRLIKEVSFTKDAVVRAWRESLMDYLAIALHAGQISSELSADELLELFEDHRTRLWFGDVKYGISRSGFLVYISRYLLRSPAAECRLQPSDSPDEVCFIGKDTKAGNRYDPMILTVSDFIARFLDQIPDRYRNGVQYFGLLAPRSRGAKLGAFLALLGQKQRSRPRRLRWADSIRQIWGRDPLLDSRGVRMHWAGRIAPVTVDGT